MQRALAATTLMIFVGASAADVARQASSSAAIRGVVRDAVTGRLLGGAIVNLFADGERAERSRQFTDDRGRFVFTDLPPDAGYRITASLQGHFEGAFGQPAATGYAFTPVALTDGQWFDAADIDLWPTGAITGTVVDDLDRLVTRRRPGG